MRALGSLTAGTLWSVGSLVAALPQLQALTLRDVAFSNADLAAALPSCLNSLSTIGPARLACSGTF
jgi:hypothetical protein